VLSRIDTSHHARLPRAGNPDSGYLQDRGRERISGVLSSGARDKAAARRWYASTSV